MRRLIVPAGRYLEHVSPETADRTAVRDVSLAFTGDVEVKVFPSRAALKTTVAMQSRRAPLGTDWRPVVKFAY